jgi:hypothetical protein
MPRPSGRGAPFPLNACVDEIERILTAERSRQGREPVQV